MKKESQNAHYHAQSVENYFQIIETAKDNDSDCFPEWVYENLPNLLRESCEVFQVKHERDIYLTGALAVLGGCFHNLYAYNDIDKKSVATNLISIIVAPPASGKGVLNYARKLASKIRNTYANKSQNGKDSGPKSRLFIPANISSTGMLLLLEQNEGAGVMVETEIDTIVNANKQEWGNYSEILRKAFEGEEYTLFRKGDGKSEPKYLQIDSVKLSIAISGTPNQFRTLMQSPENGLFSRGCYYVYQPLVTRLKFTGRLSSENNVEANFANFADIADRFYKVQLTHSAVHVVIKEHQLKKIGEVLQWVLDVHSDSYEIQGNIVRAFILAQKLSALFEYLYQCEKGTVTENIECSDKANDLANVLTLLYLWHSFNAYELLPSSRRLNIKGSQQRLYLRLPEQFTKVEAIEVGLEIGLPERTTYDALKKLENKQHIVLNPEGYYSKN